MNPLGFSSDIMLSQMSNIQPQSDGLKAEMSFGEALLLSKTLLDHAIFVC